MLQITVPEREIFVEATSEFIHVKEQTLKLEHSLVSLHKWESKWHKPFLEPQNGKGPKREKTQEEILDYIKCMTLTQNVDPNVYLCLTNENIKAINDYIENPMTATTFPPEAKGGKQRIITAELLYYWMLSLQIPIKCEKWHLNKLLTLIRVCNVENAPPKKRSTAEIMKSNRELNAARRKKLNTKG